MPATDPAFRIRSLETSLRRTQRQLAKVKDRNDELARVTVQACEDAVRALGPIRPVPKPPADRRRLSPEVALWHLTDWQGGKKTRSYNSAVMVRRMARFTKAARIITDMRRGAAPVRDCVILFGGDMVEGISFQFPTQPFEIDSTLFTQYVNVARLMVETVRTALSMFDHITVIAEWGNHGRVGSKRDTVPRSDNFDRMAYEFARGLLADESRLTWADCPNDIQRVQLGAYRALLIHGDEIGRNGYASPNMLVQWATRQKSGAYPWSFHDVYMGHYHTHAEWPLPDGRGSVYQTGSLESDNRYVGVLMAAQAIPSQRLHFVDPEKGRVIAVHKIWTVERWKA